MSVKPGTVRDVAPRLTVKDAAKFLGVSEDTIYRLTRSGELGCNRVGKLVRIGPEHIADYLERTECPARALTEAGNSNENQGAQAGSRTDAQTPDLNGFRLELRTRRVLDRPLRISKGGLRIITENGQP